MKVQVNSIAKLSCYVGGGHASTGPEFIKYVWLFTMQSGVERHEINIRTLCWQKSFSKCKNLIFGVFSLLNSHFSFSQFLNSSQEKSNASGPNPRLPT